MSDPPPRICKGCGGLISPYKMKRQTKFCLTVCKNRYHKRHAKNAPKIGEDLGGVVTDVR